jgi:NADH dehydrogenase [ubiquinone] 1 alpha subcomplex assembly factor 7
MSTPLCQRIARAIAAEGPMTVAEYMTRALHDPQGGYYATRDPLGEGGDFITAPEISQMFGELVALAIAEAWSDWGAPERPTLVELGPGRGTLMRDMLRALKVVPRFRAQLRVAMVESSPTLRAVQQRTLVDTDVPIRWANSFAEAGIDGPLYVVANEFFDALPIRQWVHVGHGAFNERMVGRNAQGALRFEVSPFALNIVPPGGAVTPVGTIYETCDSGENLLEDIARAIQERWGAAFVFDYGYGAPGFGETLQAVRRHAYADVLSDPGENDLTAHVNFQALAEAARRGGAEPAALMTQGEVLKMWGIEARAERLGGSGVLTRQVQRLTAADQMGELFKVLCIVPKDAPLPSGFSRR